MARCFNLQSFSVEEADGSCLVHLEGWGFEPVEWFERILVATFPESGFSRLGDPSDSGFLGLEKLLILAGDLPPGGVSAMENFLSLLSRSLTIEDSLDESHSLGYHQDEDESTGDLIRSPLGTLLRDAKYRSDANARQRIAAALAKFIDGHPRYRRAGAIAAVPPHEVSVKNSLCQRIVAAVGNELGFNQIEILRVSSRPPQKDIVDEDRVKGVERRINNQMGSMRVGDDTPGLRVVVLDNLYGSGGSMQEAARTLREAGAEEILGLTVTKQRLYEGVRLAAQD